MVPIRKPLLPEEEIITLPGLLDIEE